MFDSRSRKNPLVNLWLGAVPALAAMPARRAAPTLTTETTRLWIDAILSAARPSTRRKNGQKQKR